jgi:diguanylate cyclase (GGDEF)-like protein
VHAEALRADGPVTSALVDSLHTAVVQLDTKGAAVFANSAAACLLGAEPLARAFLQPLPLREWLADEASPELLELEHAGERLWVQRRRYGEGWLLEVRAAAGGASRDPLTGLAGREELRRSIAAQLARFQRGGDRFAVLCIDLDRFKAVNDTLGHPMGDALLRRVAERLAKAARREDLVARLGGDEFAILQIGAGQPEAAEALAARLVDLIGRSYVVDGHMLNIGASVGVALAGADGTDPDVLLKNADLALYRAKSDGRGVFRFFEQEMDARMQARRSLEIDLRRALALKEFELAYQPQVQASDGVVTGFEALLRWRHPERGQVSPADFVPLAEEIGLIAPIGEWVLRTACREAAQWSRPVSIAVNLSPVQFRGAKLAAVVASALAQSGLPPERLELEITEGALLEDTEAVLEVLQALRELGVRISMDDFGTGYSSLSYLQKFPFTKIKIDQTFVRQMEHNADCRAIVRAVAALGRSLGMKTTAEGVETEAQRDRIRAEGCTEIQGYLTGRPMSAAAAAELLNEPVLEGPST